MKKFFKSEAFAWVSLIFGISISFLSLFMAQDGFDNMIILLSVGLVIVGFGPNPLFKKVDKDDTRFGNENI